MRCGFVALVGQPNVGKSTLMNYLLGQKISITSRKPQTTRHRILGIRTTEHMQAVYVDTPGMHQGGKKALNRYLNRTADSTLTGVDLVLWLIDELTWQVYDETILRKLRQADLPVILVINKIDKIKDKTLILKFLQDVQERYPFRELVPVSALKQTNLDRLESLIAELLPDRMPVFPEEQITDRSERFLAAEIIREKLTRRLGEELPYSLTVEIERYEENPTITKIYAVIWVERGMQKNIVIGRQGDMLKKVGIDARRDIENLIDRKCYLQLWVKVKKGWSDSEKALQSLGFNE